MAEKRTLYSFSLQVAHAAHPIDLEQERELVERLAAALLAEKIEPDRELIEVLTDSAGRWREQRVAWAAPRLTEGEVRALAARGAHLFDECVEYIEALPPQLRWHIEPQVAPPPCEVLRALPHARELAAMLGERFGQLARHYTQPRADADLPLRNLIAGLANVWEGLLSRRAGRSYNPVGDTHGGPFVRFVSAVVEAIDPGKKPAGLGDLIRDVLAKRAELLENEGPKPAADLEQLAGRVWERGGLRYEEPEE